MGLGGADIHTTKGVTNALVLTRLNLASSICKSKTRQWGRLTRVYCIHIYILTHTWGFQHCSFRLTGQCESLDAWNERKTGSTLFLVCIHIKHFCQPWSQMAFEVSEFEMNVIQNNPYRLLGVFSNSPTKERVANSNRLKAFLKVGKAVSFPLDLPQFMPVAERSERTVAEADSKLALPKDLLLYAQFWFVKITPLDDVAFNNLFAGEIDKAENIWQKKDCVSSLQNRVVLSLLRDDFANAISCAEILYGNTLYVEELVSSIVGDGGIYDVSNLVFSFLDVLCNEVGTNKLISCMANSHSTWKNHIIENAVKPLVDSIQEAINIAQKAKGKGSSARLKAGETLRRNTRNAILQLKGFLTTKDLQYQMIADKLGLEILQCGIDYFNDSEELDAAPKAMSLQKYAKSIVVGQMAKDRCKDNVHILEDIIRKLPPGEVASEDSAIKSYLSTFAMQPSLIRYSIRLIKDCAPYIVSIKEKLGTAHPYYLKISTEIVGCALGNIVSEVNDAQERDFETLKNALIEAWRTQLYMDKFDLELEFKEGRYKQSREALYGIIDQCKGFEDKAISFMYKYGSGWCNKLDVSDVDLRTDDEFYASCNNLTSFKAYARRFPSGKHIIEANQQIEVLTYQSAHTVDALNNFIKKYPESKYVPKAKAQIIELRFKGCKSISDFRTFINDFPTCKFVSKAQDAIDRLIREENERKARIARQEKAIAACHFTDEVLGVYAKEKSNHIDVDKCSSKAYDLAKTESDYRKIIDTFGIRTPGGEKAKLKVTEIESNRRKRKERRNKMFKWSIGLIIPVAILFIVYLIWGIKDIGLICYIFAWLFGLIAFGGICSKDGAGFVVGIISGVIAFGFGHLSGYLEDIYNEQKDNSTELVEKDSSNDDLMYSDSNVVDSQFDIPTTEDNTLESESQTDTDYDTYINNQLRTGAKPYKDFYRSRTGSNYLDFNTSGCDYVIIVRDYETSEVVNHIYVRADDRGRLYLPNGTYNIFFYGGKGWNPNMENGNVTGGFVSGGDIQKDGPVELYNQYGEYTLYPVQNGNLELQGATKNEAL